MAWRCGCGRGGVELRGLGFLDVDWSGGGFSFGRVGSYAVNGFCVALEGGCVDGRMCLFVSF